MKSDLGNKKVMSRNIQTYMTKKGINRKELSKVLDTPYTTVCDWINCKTYPRIDKIEMMANYFGISKAELVESEARVNYYLDSARPELTELLEVAKKCSREDVKLAIELLSKLSR